jgi:hypothetical protein
MKTMKKLHVAAAAAALLATLGAAHAATISQSGGTLATEVIIPNIAAATPAGNFTRVRAPAVTYSYVNGPNAQANGTQVFHVIFTLGSATGAPQWAGPATTHAEVAGVLPTNGVPAMTLDPIKTAETITARLRGTVVASRVAVLGNVNPGPNQFAIVLRSIKIGETLPNVSAAAHPLTPQTLMYTFELVNNTTSPIALSDLDITFNTSKQQGLTTDYFVAGQTFPNVARDFDGTGGLTATTTSAEYAAIHNLASIGIGTATGHAGTILGTAGCTVDPEPRVTIRGNSGINGIQGTEIDTNTTSTTVPTFNPSYLIVKRATDIIVGKGPGDRLIAVTNSFSTNLGANPTNGTGGTGGGRYTFKPTVPRAPTITFNAGENPTVTATASAVPVAGTSIATTPGDIKSVSGDERDMVLGVIGFRNRAAQASDRLFLSDFYGFTSPVGRAFATGDFSTPANPNVLGGVDINASGALPAVRVTAAYSGAFAQGAAFRLVDLAALPAGSQTCTFAVANNAGIVITRSADTGSTFNIDLTHAQLVAAAGANATVNNRDFTVCYNIPGTTTVPSLRFGTVTATLFKDDVTEQTLTSCPSTFSGLSGGVKVDVRNFAMSYASAANTSILGILRVINNSETDIARVDGQYIWNDGAYGNWGTLVNALPARGAVYITDSQVAAALTTAPTASALYPTRAGVPTAALLNANNPAVNGTGVVNGSGVLNLNGASSIRLRISADVSTLRVQNYIYDTSMKTLVEVSSSQGADFANIESSNRDHIDQDAQTDIKK